MEALKVLKVTFHPTSSGSWPGKLHLEIESGSADEKFITKLNNGIDFNAVGPLPYIGKRLKSIKSKKQVYALLAFCALKKLDGKHNSVQHMELATLPGWEKITSESSAQATIRNLLSTDENKVHVDLIDKSTLSFGETHIEIDPKEKLSLRRWLGDQTVRANEQALPTLGMLRTRRADDIQQTRFYAEKVLNVLYVSYPHDNQKGVALFKLWRCWIKAQIEQDCDYISFEHNLLINRHRSNVKNSKDRTPIHADVEGFGFLSNCRIEHKNPNDKSIIKVSKRLDRDIEDLSCGGYYVQSEEDMSSVLEEDISKMPQEWFGFIPIYPVASIETWICLESRFCGDVRACTTYAPSLSILNNINNLIAKNHSIEETLGPYGKRLHARRWRRKTPPDNWAQIEFTPPLPINFFDEEKAQRSCYYAIEDYPNPLCNYFYIWKLIR